MVQTQHRHLAMTSTNYLSRGIRRCSCHQHSMYILVIGDGLAKTVLNRGLSSTAPLAITSSRTLEEVVPPLHESPRQMTPRTPTKTEHIDKSSSPTMQNHRKRPASISGEYGRTATKRRSSRPMSSELKAVIEPIPVNASVPEGTHYVFISETDVPVSSQSLFHLRRKLCKWVDADRVRADHSGYALVFGATEKDGAKAKDCARYHEVRGELFFHEYELKMTAARKSRSQD